MSLESESVVISDCGVASSDASNKTLELLLVSSTFEIAERGCHEFVAFTKSCNSSSSGGVVVVVALDRHGGRCKSPGDSLRTISVKLGRGEFQKCVAVVRRRTTGWEWRERRERVGSGSVGEKSGTNILEVVDVKFVSKSGRLLIVLVGASDVEPLGLIVCLKRKRKRGDDVRRSFSVVVTEFNVVDLSSVILAILDCF